jgi:hypothetical protein
MAVVVQEIVAARKSPALKGYRIHEDQVRNVARHFREMYHIRRTRGSGGKKERGADTCPGGTVSAGALSQDSGGTRWVTGTIQGPLIYSPGEETPSWKSPGSLVRAIRCSRCGTLFPLADFLYTRKSGLCIDCWEAQVI